MNGYKGDEKDRKLMIPVAAIFMSVVALVGIGYATMTSTVENNDNPTLGDEAYIDLYTKENNDYSVVTGEYAFNMATIPYSVNTVTAKGTSGAETTRTYSIESGTVTISIDDLYLGIENFDASKTYNVTMTVKETVGDATSSFFSGFTLTVGSTDKAMTDGIATIDISSQYTSIVLKGTLNAVSDQAFTGSLQLPEIDVSISMTV